MVSDEELNNLIETARKNGAKILIECDVDVFKTEGRWIVDTVTIDAPGVGPYPMSSIAAAETLRKWNTRHEQKPNREEDNNYV